MFLLHSARMVCIFLILFPSPVLVAQTTTKGPRLRTIIVDPGHGGSDQGAKGRYSTEAELTLKISLKVEEMLRKALPDTRIVMTRTIDVFHNPRERQKSPTGKRRLISLYTRERSPTHQASAISPL